MTKKLTYIVWAVMTACLMAACDSFHEDPVNGGVNPTLVNAKFTLKVNLDRITENTPVTYSAGGAGCDIRYTVDIIYDAGAHKGERAMRKVFTTPDSGAGEQSIIVEAQLPADKYRVHAWVDHVEAGTTCDYLYNTDDLCRITLIEPYVGCSHDKDAFSGTTQVDLTPYRDRYSVEVEQEVETQRPYGCFKIIASDLAKYVASITPAGSATANPGKMPATARVSFTCYFPCGYDITTGKATPDDFKTGISFTGGVTEQLDRTATLAFDYVFVCSDETTVTAKIEVFDAAGNLINTVPNVSIAIHRDRLTVISGAFLTRDYENGDIGIDDGFDEEIIVPLPD